MLIALWRRHGKIDEEAREGIQNRPSSFGDPTFDADWRKPCTEAYYLVLLGKGANLREATRLHNGGGTLPAEISWTRAILCWLRRRS